MNNLLALYEYIKLKIEVTLYNIFQDDGGRCYGEFEDKL